jgi:hypothetical protein
MSEREETTDTKRSEGDDAQQEKASQISEGSVDHTPDEAHESKIETDAKTASDTSVSDKSVSGKSAVAKTNGSSAEKNGAAAKALAKEAPLPSDDSPSVAKKSKASTVTGPTQRVETWREMIANAYFTIDRRTLGLSRILLGWLLVGDLFRRTPDWIHMFGDKGVLPTVTILSRPQGSNFSFLQGFSENWELWALWAVMFVTFTCVLIGYKTKVAQVLSLLFVTSLNGRVSAHRERRLRRPQSAPALDDVHAHGRQIQPRCALG